MIGAGLSGAAVAASLARRGWQVEVLDAAPAPASGASGLPAGLLAPHISPDDSVLSRLSRCGVRLTLQQVRALLREGVDWQQTGLLEHRVDGHAALPVQWLEAGRDWTAPASALQLAQAGLTQGHARLLAHAGGLGQTGVPGASPAVATGHRVAWRRTGSGLDAR